MSYYMRGKNGFTLLEIMVSMAIMAIALVTVIQLFSGALRSAKVSHDYSLAVMGAKEKMDEALAVTTLNEFDELEKAGEFESEMMEGYRWEIKGPDPYQMPEGLAMDIEEESGVFDDLPFKLYQIVVRVIWASGLHEKEVKFTTIKMLEEED
ncbi:MAG: type II secretion system protein [Thermoplasmata archaeon]|nr:MAG: type II secretion system protein [Thermoplasmata archaeon]